MTACEKHDSIVVREDRFGKCELCEAEEKINQLENELETAKSEIKDLQKQLEEQQ